MLITAKRQRKEWVQNTAGKDVEPIIGCATLGDPRFPQVGSGGTLPGGSGVNPYNDQAPTSNNTSSPNFGGFTGPQVCPWGVRWGASAIALALEHACAVLTGREANGGNTMALVHEGACTDLLLLLLATGAWHWCPCACLYRPLFRVAF